MPNAQEPVAFTDNLQYFHSTNELRHIRSPLIPMRRPEFVKITVGFRKDRDGTLPKQSRTSLTSDTSPKEMVSSNWEEPESRILAELPPSRDISASCN